MPRYSLIAILAGCTVLAQTGEEPVVLRIDIENHVLYRASVFDAARIGADPGPLAAGAQVPFVSGINIGDIVAVNGTPVRGIWSSAFTHTTAYRIAPQPGQFIASADSGATFFCTWQIFATDGSFLGTILDSGATGGHAISGALAGFFGSTGIHAGMAFTGSRVTITAENPANRRNHGGGRGTVTFHLYPRFRPAIRVLENGPAVLHSDLTPVSMANPARPGEVLIVSATGLGPVKPDVQIPPGAITFSASPIQEVNSPVSVIFNGRELPAINKVGWPGETNVYRVDFQVPSDAAAGMATVHLTAMWIPGPPVTIPVGAGR
jgi:uncharacterized protein (TIGR03437 family)